jgi:hypothetical protein
MAFTASYMYDAWWVEPHPHDPLRVSLRAHDGSFLANGKTSYVLPVISSHPPLVGSRVLAWGYQVE